MVWTVDMDDFSGDVCGGDVKYPLIGAMRYGNTKLAFDILPTFNFTLARFPN